MFEDLDAQFTCAASLFIVRSFSKMRTLLVGLAGSISLSLLVAASPVMAAPDTSVAAMSSPSSSPDGAKDVAQVSSVSELTDVDPNNWAFQALKSLVERYGCIEGYPSKKYLGNRPLSRYEFAAGLNACLDKIGEQIAAATEPLATKDDLAAVQRLQEEFKAELATLKGRTDALEAKTKELEAQQFSTTTKLDADTVFAIAGASAGGNVNTNNDGANIPGSSQNVIFGTRTRLNVRAKNLGVQGDELRIRLTGTTDGGSFFGTNTPATNDVRVGRIDYLQPGTTNVNGNSRVNFDKLYYQFPLFSKDFKVSIGPRVENKDILGLQKNTRDELTQFSLRGFHRNIGLALVGGQAPGIAASWKLSDQWSVGAIYSALAGGDSNGFGNGGVTGPSQAAIELGFKPDKNLELGLGYYRTVCNGVNNTLSTDGNPRTPLNDGEGPGSQNRIFCAADSGGSSFYPFTGNSLIANSPISNVQHDTINFHADWEFAPDISLFGRYSFGTATVNSATPGIGANLSYSEWLAGLSFNNTFGRKGDALGIAVLQPANITSNNAANVTTTFGNGTFPAGSNVPTATELNYGIYYRYTLTKNFTVGPEVYLITNPGGIAGNPSVTEAIFRATYKY
jgi:Carbohydrate-selective porin, OprB family/S-layer homology domain